MGADTDADCLPDVYSDSTARTEDAGADWRSTPGACRCLCGSSTSDLGGDDRVLAVYICNLSLSQPAVCTFYSGVQLAAGAVLHDVCAGSAAYFLQCKVGN